MDTVLVVILIVMGIFLLMASIPPCRREATRLWRHAVRLTKVGGQFDGDKNKQGKHCVAVYAPWCGYSRRFLAIDKDGNDVQSLQAEAGYHQLEKDPALDDITFHRLNVDASQTLSDAQKAFRDQHAPAFPSTVCIQDGEVKGVIRGMRSMNEMKTKLAEIFGTQAAPGTQPAASSA